MSRRDRIERALATGLSVEHLEVVDESHRHSRGAESHYNVTVVSPAFEGESRVARHRRVHGLLESELAAGLHALTLTLMTPSEWARGGRALESPGCRGGSKLG
jgi:BolA family transcriptional regulator, general stress-responsive regulator